MWWIYVLVVLFGAGLWVLETWLAKKDAQHQAELRARARHAAEERAKAETAARSVIVPPRPTVRRKPS